LKVGDKVIVHFTNNLPIPTSVHWHGVELSNRSDGTGITQNSVLPGETFTYDFIVPRPGIFFYHSHAAPTNPIFKGYYGSIIVEDPAEARLRKRRVLPPIQNTLTLVLGDTTVCKQPGSNDAVTFAPDETGTVPWAGNGLFPGKYPFPSPQQLCENPIDEHGHLAGTGPLPAGSIPNIQPTNDCGAPGQPACPVHEGQLVLTNGKVPAARAGSPSAPGSLAPNAEVIDVTPGHGMRLQLIGAAGVRYFRLRMTDHLGEQITLFRVGGQGGLLDEVRVEGGIQGSLDTKYDRGELLLPPGSREDVVFVVPAGRQRKGDVLTLWTLDYRSAGPNQGNAGFSALPTVPVAHFRVVPQRNYLGPFNRHGNFRIAEGDALRIHPKAHSHPVENLKTTAVNGALLDPNTFTPVQPGSANQTMTFTYSPLATMDSVDGSLFDEGVIPPDRFTDVPHIASSRFASVGSLLELTIKNDTFSHHPWHPHGFSIQPVRFIDNATGSTLFEFPFNEFVDTVDIPRLASLVYRMRLDDRPFDFATPTGGAIGRWAMHCHIFPHAAAGMITELVAVSP
jgi:FtsP/CotA-like multicopper oxidase with cupredoxin domain